MSEFLRLFFIYIKLKEIVGMGQEGADYMSANYPKYFCNTCTTTKKSQSQYCLTEMERWHS